MTDSTVFLAVVLLIGYYLLGAYAFSRIGRKFDVGSFGAFCVPIYNLVLLCRCGGISGGAAAGVVLPMFIGWILLSSGALSQQDAAIFFVIAMIISIGFLFYLWGSVAKRLGKDFFLYGLFTSLLAFPLLILAFDTSRPVAKDPEAWLPRIREAEYAVIAEPPAKETLIEVAAPRLFFVEGLYAGESLDLPFDGILLGRDPNRVHLVLNASDISGIHARIAPDPWDMNRFILEDLNSKNGTFCEGSHPPGQGGPDWTPISGAVMVDRGTRFKIGDNVFMVK